jgi:hypothetical protein
MLVLNNDKVCHVTCDGDALVLHGTYHPVSLEYPGSMAAALRFDVLTPPTGHLAGEPFSCLAVQHLQSIEHAQQMLCCCGLWNPW